MLNQRIKHSSPYYIMIFITAFLGVGILNANAAENEKGYMDPRAMEVLKNASDFIGKAKTLSIKATVSMDRHNFWRCSKNGKSIHPWMRRFSPSIHRLGQRNPS